MSSSERARVGLVIVVWVLTVVEVLLMGAAGMAKFVGDAWVQMFVGWGYPAWFTYVVGATEVLGAVALLAPRVTSYAAILLVVVMLGAIGTLMTASVETPLGPTQPIIHIAILSVLMRARWPRRWRARGSVDPS